MEMEVQSDSASTLAEQHGPPNKEKGEGVLRRIWRYKFHYIVVLPAMLLLLYYKVLPFLTGARVPFIQYSPFKGIMESPWVGWDNFRTLFQQPAFRRVLANTVTLKMSYMLVCSVLAIILALALSGIVSRRLKYGFATLFLLPYFIPSAVAAYIVQHILSLESLAKLGISVSPLLDESLFPFVLVLAEAVKTCGIPALLALAVMEAKAAAAPLPGTGSGMLQPRLVSAVRIALAFILLQLSSLLATDFELLHSLQSPPVLRTAETLATYQYRTGLLSMQFSLSAAAWLLQFVLQLVFTFAAYLLVRKLFKGDLFPGLKDKPGSSPSGRKSSIAGLLAASLYASLLAALLYGLFIYPFTVKSAFGLSVWDIAAETNMLGYAVLYLACTVIFMLLTLALAYPLTVKDLPGRRGYKALLLAVMVMGTGAIHEYLFFRNQGMFDTIYPAAISGLYSIASVFVLKSIFNSRFSGLKDQAAAAGNGEMRSFFCLFIPKVWKPLIGLGVLQFAVLWGSYYPSLLYINNPNLAPPVMAFRSAATGAAAEAMNGDPVILQVAAIVSLLPVILLLVFRPLLTPEVMISQLRK
ncbi:MAG: hypothetical protein K0R57_3504 [Paenibacillaceae bacterium]|jgi:ABC-type polysaccharide transport system permease subunit|nr:hypothetical protein [Paenibacillaceae bacterium]